MISERPRKVDYSWIQNKRRLLIKEEHWLELGKQKV